MLRGPVSERLRVNVRALRDAAGMDQASLARRLAELGHPIPTNSISRLENGERRADVDDLVALAIALGVAPNRLLLSEGASAADEVGLTATLNVDERSAWRWAAGDRPLLGGGTAGSGGDVAFGRANRPHDPPDPTTLGDIERYAAELEDLLDEVARRARDLGLPTRTVLVYARLAEVLLTRRDDDGASQ